MPLIRLVSAETAPHIMRFIQISVELFVCIAIFIAIAAAVAEHRKETGVTGPLYIGADTHALSEPALRSCVEVLAANGVDGIHIYTMNRPVIAQAAHDALVGCGYLAG